MVDTENTNEFELHAKSGRTNLFQEFWGFINHNKKWWLTPIILLIMFVGVMIILGGSGVAPFIYTLF